MGRFEDSDLFALRAHCKVERAPVIIERVAVSAMRGDIQSEHPLNKAKAVNVTINGALTTKRRKRHTVNISVCSKDGESIDPRDPDPKNNLSLRLMNLVRDTHEH